MNFEDLISLAKSNEEKKKSKPSLYYPAKLAPPKKATWKSRMKSLPCSVVKKYLSTEAVKEQVNVLNREDYKKKYLRLSENAEKDHNNDDINNEDFTQPDEDDWGFVGEEHNAQYNNILEMYRKLPPEKPLFTPDKREKPTSDIASTKEKVKNALKRQKEEESKKKKRGRSKKAETSTETSDAPVDFSEILNKVVKQQIDKMKDGKLFFSDIPAENANKFQVQTKLFVNESGNVRLDKSSAKAKENFDDDPIYTNSRQPIARNSEKEEEKVELSGFDEAKELFGDEHVRCATNDSQQAREGGYSSREAILADLEDIDKENLEKENQK